jgi:hypothetical protein
LGSGIAPWGKLSAKKFILRSQSLHSHCLVTWLLLSQHQLFFSDLFLLMPLFDGASSAQLDLLSTSRVYSGLLCAFIADPHAPLYLIKKKRPL